MNELLTQLSELASDLPTGESLLALLVCGACLFAFGYLFGWAFTFVPYFRWFLFFYIVIIGIQGYPDTLNFKIPACYIYWGIVAPFIRALIKKANLRAPSLPSLSIPRISSNRTPRISPDGRIDFPRHSLMRFIGWIFRFIGETLYFVFIRFPVYLIRLVFWLKSIWPHLKTRAGWWLLCKGLLAWIGNLLWQMLPFSWRAEIRQGMTGKSVKDSFNEDIKGAYEREKERQRKRDEEELRRLFRRMKRHFQNAARNKRDPFEDVDDDEPYGKSRTYEEEQAYRRKKAREQWESDPSHRPFEDFEQEDSDFYREQQRRAKEAQQRRHQQQRQSSQSQQKEQNTSSSQSRQSQRASSQSQNQSSTHSGSSQKSQNQYWEDTQRKAQQNRQQQQKAASDKPLDPRSKAFYDKHKKDFQKAKWEYEPSEERFTGGRSAYEIIGVSRESTKSERKKAYHKLSKKYGPYMNPVHPTTVQERANEIMKEINGANSKINPRK